MDSGMVVAKGSGPGWKVGLGGFIRLETTPGSTTSLGKARNCTIVEPETTWVATLGYVATLGASA